MNNYLRLQIPLAVGFALDVNASLMNCDVVDSANSCTEDKFFSALPAAIEQQGDSDWMFDIQPLQTVKPPLLRQSYYIDIMPVTEPRPTILMILALLGLLVVRRKAMDAIP